MKNNKENNIRKNTNNESKDYEIEPYFSQQDVARIFNTSPRMLLYWENQGLIHPTMEKHARGKERKYKKEDLEEIRFIKALIDDGYTTQALKKKLATLSSPYRYNLNNLFWDFRDKKWKIREKIAQEYLREEIKKIFAASNPLEEMVNFIFDLLDKKL